MVLFHYKESTPEFKNLKIVGLHNHLKERKRLTMPMIQYDSNSPLKKLIREEHLKKKKAIHANAIQQIKFCNDDLSEENNIFDTEIHQDEKIAFSGETTEKSKAKKVMNFSMDFNKSVNDNDLDEKEQYIESDLPQTEKTQIIKNIPKIHELETTSDGVGVFPVTIGSYSEIILQNEEQKNLAKSICRPSLIKTPCGIKNCAVIKTSNCYAMLRKCRKNEDFEMIWIMTRADITNKVKAADGKVYIDVVIKDDLSEKSVRIPFSDFLEGRINNFMKYGLSLHTDFSFTMSVYFQRLIEKMPTEDASHKLGIVLNNQTGQYEFNAYKLVDGFEKHTDFEDWDEYCDAINDLIKVSPAMQYLISVTMSAPVLTLLQKKYHLDLHSYVVNIVGASSTGKTITQRLCASMWTYPASDKIFSAALSTSNAALKRLDGRWGIVTIIDEATVLGNISPTEYAYSVYEEREKRRLNSDCSEKVSGTWSTIAIMSSEQHFHNNSKVQNGGMAVRVHSMENLEFTKSKEHADKVNNFIKDNYGITGYEFTNMLFDDDMDDLEELYEEAKVTMHSYVENNMSDLTPRLVNTYAITYMTALLLEDMGLAINPDAVAKIMAEHNAMVASEQNLALNAYHAIISYMARNPFKGGIRKFETEDGALIKIAIEESLTQEILSKAGFTDLKVTIKEMDKAGYLIRQQDGRLKSKLTIDGNLGYTYQFDLSKFSEGVVSPKEKVKSLIYSDEYEYDI